MPALHLALHFVRRDIRSRYLGSFSGGAWALLQPLVQLAVYGVVFVYVFKARAPGADAPGYVPFLALALWPWVAFSESVSRAATAIQDNAALIGKIALPREVLVFAAVAASFTIHGVGFCAIVIALKLFGAPLDLLMLPVALCGFVQLFVFALGVAFLLAAVQVFVRDLAPALPQLLMLWMFASPIFYARSQLPERFQGWLDVNPFTHYAELFRALLLHSGAISSGAQLVSLLIAVLTFAFGYVVFRRLAPHFEDFL
jgi:lipopolysaccharide transport system permease protein